jgi:hypothetical protein
MNPDPPVTNALLGWVATASTYRSACAREVSEESGKKQA